MKNTTQNLLHELIDVQRLAHIGSWSWDAQTDVMAGSDEFLRIFGFDPTTQTMPNFRNQKGRCYPEDEWEKIHVAALSAMDSGVGYELDVRAFRNGAPIWVRSISEAVKDVDGRIIGLRGTAQDITEHKVIEAAVLERQFKLDAIVGHSPSALSLKTPDGRYALANPNLQRIHHLTEDEIIGKTDFDLYPAATAAAFKANDMVVLSTMARHSIEEVIPVDGTMRTYMSHMFPILNNKGEAAFICRISLDITARKEADLRLQQSEEEFRLLAEAMPQIVWCCNADGMNEYFNRHWMEYTGMTMEESSGHGWNKPFHPDDQQRAWEAWRNAVENNGAYSLECRLRRFDGVYQWWLIRGVPYIDDDGNIEKWFGTCTDIEAIKKTEAELSANEQMFHSILDSVPSTIALIDAEGNILAVNKNWHLFALENALIPGQQPSNIDVGSNYFSVCQSEADGQLPQEAKEAYQGIRAVIDGRSTLFTMDYPCNSHNQERWFTMTVTPLSAMKPGAVIKHTEITDRKIEENEKAALVLKLQTVIEDERTRISREVHDELGSLLAAIKLNLHSYGKHITDISKELTEKQHHIIGLVNSAIHSVNRITSGLRPSLLDNMGLLAAIEWYAKRYEEEYPLICRLSLPQADVALDEGMATAVFRVLQESLTNVAKHAEASHVDIEVFLEDEEITMVIHDDGKGIGERSQFHRDCYGIRGMQERARQYGGDYQVRNDRVKGTIAILRMPLRLKAHEG